MLRVAGTVRIPGDKSISHRALILAALADGESRIQGLLQSADVESTAGVLRALGVAVPTLSPDMRIIGVGQHGLQSPAQSLDCGNSGTTTRLMAGVVAGAAGVEARFVGDASLSRRPMQRIARPLTAMGATIHSEQNDGLPLAVVGTKLRSIAWVSEQASAQVKSAILLAGLMSGVEVSVNEPSRSRDHTERMLDARGVPLRVRDTGVTLPAGATMRACDVEVPADPSSAAFFVALAALAHDGALQLLNVGLNPTRTGGFDILARMGASIRFEDERDAGGEPVGTVVVSASSLVATTVSGTEVARAIDELPLIACVAARATGTTVIRDAAELRVKESDRISAVVQNLQALGVDATETSDGMIVRGGHHPLSGTVHTHGDHRLAMAFGVLAALPGNHIEIDDRRCVDVSFPSFWSTLEQLCV